MKRKHYLYPEGYTMPISKEHAEHKRASVSHNNCAECRADNERQFVPTQQWHYGHVADYLKHVRPRLQAIRQGKNSVNARIWTRQYRLALHRRIGLKGTLPIGRKWSDSYLERLKMALGGRSATERYLRTFARKGASTL